MGNALAPYDHSLQGGYVQGSNPQTYGTIPIPPPVIETRTQIEHPEFVFTDDFEGTEDTGFWGATTNSSYGVAATDDVGYLGGKVMSMNYPATNPNSTAEKRFIIPQSVQVECSYMIFVPANYAHLTPLPNNNKVFSIWSGAPSVSASNVACVVECAPQTTGIIGSTPDLTMGGNGNNFDHTGIFDGTGDRVYKTSEGSWHKIGIYIQLPENASEFGIFEVWRDDVLIMSNQWELDISAGAGGVPSDEHLVFNPTDNYLDQGYVMGWANSGFTAATTFYIDDFTMRTRTSSVGTTV